MMSKATEVIIVNEQGIHETPTPIYGKAVTPSDTDDLENPGKLHVNVSGNIKFRMLGNQEEISLTDFSGWLPAIVDKVFDTGTTATEITVYW